MYQNVPTKVLTGNARLSYARLDKPAPPSNNPLGEPKYSATLLIPKSDLATKADIDGSIEAAIQKATVDLWGGARPPMLGLPKFPGYEYPKNEIPIYDGDGVRANGEPFGPECKGHWVITASSKMKPQVVGADNINVQLSPSDIYSGMWARVTINFFCYNISGKKGVGCGLNNVMKTRDDEPLAGGASASSDFAGVGNSVAVPPQTQYQPAPPQTQYQPASPQTYPGVSSDIAAAFPLGPDDVPF
jgi:hypothetical protein